MLGVPDAYELPPIPGSGFLKVDTSVFQRFKAGYVSGTYRPPVTGETVIDADPVVAPFPLFNDTAGYLAAMTEMAGPAGQKPPGQRTTRTRSLPPCSTSRSGSWRRPVPAPHRSGCRRCRSQHLDAITGPVRSDDVRGLVADGPGVAG